MDKRLNLPTGLAGSGLLIAAFFGSPGSVAADDAPRREDARVELGRRLFFDPAVGRRGRVSCSACHDPEHGFSDSRTRSADEDRELPRHSQPLVDLAGDGFHWDGEFDTVRDVIDARILPGALPLKSAAERALARVRVLTAGGKSASDEALSLATKSLTTGQGYSGASLREPVVVQMPISGRVAANGIYDAGFVAAFDDAAVTPRRIGDALEAYVRSLASTTNPYDRYAAGDSAALGESAARGLDLFRGKAACSQCHVMDGARAAFTDGKFHNTGVETRRAETSANSKSSKPKVDLGRLGTTFGDADRGAFKTPGLRDVARRAPYFHDGSGASLADVVDYYDKGGTKNDHLDARLHPLGLSAEERADLVAFLTSLTGDVRPGLGRPTSLRSPRISVHVENLDGTPCVRRSVRVQPSGDRLATVEAMPSATSVLTDERGDAVVQMPATTHVVLSTDAGNATPLLPDWTKSARIVVMPSDKVSLVLRFPDEAAGRPAKFVAYSSATRPSMTPVRFEKVRDLSRTESLYVTPAPGQARAGACLVCVDPVIDAGMVFAMNFAPGATNRVDLRLDHAPTDPAELAAATKAVQDATVAFSAVQRDK